jgi:hypothetical protein
LAQCAVPVLRSGFMESAEEPNFLTPDSTQSS